MRVSFIVRAARSSVLNDWFFVFEAAGGRLGRDAGAGWAGVGGACFGVNNGPFRAFSGAGVWKNAPGSGF